MTAKKKVAEEPQFVLFNQFEEAILTGTKFDIEDFVKDELDGWNSPEDFEGWYVVEVGPNARKSLTVETEYTITF